MNSQSMLITRPELKEFCVLQPWRTVTALVLDWIVIAAAIAASEYSGSWFAYVTAVAVIGGRMHGLGVLMHESAHYRFFRNRFLGDWIGNLFAAWPILATVDGYRQNHLAHHRYTNTDQDPDWMAKLGDPAFSFPQKVRQLLLNTVGYLLAVNTVRDVMEMAPRISRNDRSTGLEKLIRIAYYVLLIGLVIYLGAWKQFLLYWVVPFMTALFLFQHVRSVAEHFARMDYSHELTSTRTVEPYFWERWFFAPHNINYHLEHHLYPGVPFYNLPALHDRLMQNDTYRTQAHVTRGYSTGLLGECLA